MVVDRAVPYTLGGPEQETPLERFVGLLRLPYPLASLVLGMICGSPVYYLGQYVDTGRLILPSTPYGAFVQTLFVVVPSYAILAVRFMRLRLLKMEPTIATLSAEGEASYHRAFRRVRQLTPTLFLTVILVIGLLSGQGFYAGPVSLVLQLISIPIAAFAASSAVWTYLGSVWGIHQLGKETLHFKPFYEDSMLGAGAIGSLSLSLTIVYFGGIFLAILLFLSSPALLAILLALVVVGVISFFLPLRSIHSSMLEVKERELTEVRRNFGKMLRLVNEPDAIPIQSVMLDLRNFQAHDYMERRAERIRTWPFDLHVLERLVAVIISITTILLARIIQILLKL